MKILNTTPAADGFHMPAEWEAHKGCIMIWPERADSWQYGAYAARRAFAEIVHAIAESEEVTVLCSFSQYDNARAALNDNVRVVELSTDDAWARDTAPTFVKNADGIVRGVDWGFNAWGGLYDGLYFPWDKDNKLARKLCDLYNYDVYDCRSFILEGGSIHSDGEGTLLVTEPCLLSHGRNPLLSKDEIEEKLRSYTGAEKIIWLPHGIYNDETNEHVDNICAFVAPASVVLAWTDDENDPQYPKSSECLTVLEKATDAKGRSITVHKLPLPSPVYMTEDECMGLDSFDGKPTREPGERLAASYVNFYISNGSIIMPAFGDRADDTAAAILAGLFPDRQLHRIYARDLLIGGGNIHCLTGQIPM